jgi:nicotinamide-nucleotide amidase
VSTRAGIVVTRTEVLTGRIADRNGPWVSEQLLGLGVDVAHITVCGDRPDDLTAQLRFLVDEGVDLIVTTGGLGPTADDLTVPTVAAFCGRELRHDPDLESHITDILLRWRGIDGPLPEAAAAGVRKQAYVPEDARYIPPTGTAPGIAIARTDGLPAIIVLPGPPRELQAMWPAAVTTDAFASVTASLPVFSSETIRAYRLSEAELAETLRLAERDVAGFSALEITTCIRAGEIDMVTRFADDGRSPYAELLDLMTERHDGQIFSTDGSTVDDLVAAALTGRMIGTAESCTGGKIAARLTDRAGSSEYVAGGVVSYSNEVKTNVLGVPAAMIAEHGAVSEQVAEAMADGARRVLGTDIAVSTTGIAGPGGGSAEKPVGTVCFGVSVDGAPTRTLTIRFPGDRAIVRALTVTAAMHLILETVGSLASPDPS